MLRGGLRVAFRQGGAAAEKNQIHPREVERCDVADGEFLRSLCVCDRRTGAALIVECMQFGERYFSLAQLLDDGRADQARDSDHGDSQHGGGAHRRVMTGVGETTSAHCARNLRK